MTILGNLDYDRCGEYSPSDYTDIKVSTLEKIGYNEEQIKYKDKEETFKEHSPWYRIRELKEGEEVE